MVKGDLFRAGLRGQSVFVLTAENVSASTYRGTTYHYHQFREVTRYGVPMRGRAQRLRTTRLYKQQLLENPSPELRALADEAMAMEPKAGEPNRKVKEFLSNLKSVHEKNHRLADRVCVTMSLPDTNWPFRMGMRDMDSARALGEEALLLGATQMAIVRGKDERGEIVVFRGSKSKAQGVTWELDRRRTEDARAFALVYGGGR